MKFLVNANSIKNYFTQRKFDNINEHQALIVEASLAITLKKNETNEKDQHYFNKNFYNQKRAKFARKLLSFLFMKNPCSTWLQSGEN